MYLARLMKTSDVPGKITFRKMGSSTYGYFEYKRAYNSAKQYQDITRAATRKLSASDATMMFPMSQKMTGLKYPYA